MRTNERIWEKESSGDLQNRMDNLFWAVCGDYDQSLETEGTGFLKSKYIGLYEAVRQGAFEKYFDRKKYNRFFANKVYGGWEASVLGALGRLCIDSAVWKKAAWERKGVEDIRRRAFADTLSLEAGRLTQTDWGAIEACYLQWALYGEQEAGKYGDQRMRRLAGKIRCLEEARQTEEVCTCLEEVYLLAYPNGFAQFFKGLDMEIDRTDRPMQEYTDKDYDQEPGEEERGERPVNIFSGHVAPQDNGKKEEDRPVRILLDGTSTARMKEYVELNYGKSCLTPKEQKYFDRQICRGVHKDCKIHMTRGLLQEDDRGSAKRDFVKRIQEENLKVWKKNQLVTRQNIQMLANTLKRALLTRAEKEVCSSEYGELAVSKLWNLGRTENKKLFWKEFIRDNRDFAVEILIDASGSQQERQSLVALQGYILSEALSIAGIPHQVMGFCTFGAYTILHKYRDYQEEREKNQRIFQFYGSANNRDGLAIRAAGDSLDGRKEENKILIVLSDGRPNDIIAGSQNPVYGKKKAEEPPEKKPYCLEFGVKDTAGEVRRLRNRRISVLGVFAGEEEDLQAEKKIFGKDFAYIRDLSNFANVVGRYLKKQIED